jgi:hypothetical protein
MPNLLRRSGACVVVVVALVVSCFAQPAAADDAALADGASHAVSVASERGAPSCIPAAKCCKVCDVGKACGNSCISRSKNCHKGRGCACDAEEVCP